MNQFDYPTAKVILISMPIKIGDKFVLLGGM